MWRRRPIRSALLVGTVAGSSACAQEIAASAPSLADTAEQLNALVGRFTLA